MINMFLLHLKRCYNTHVDYILTFLCGNITCNISIIYAEENLGGSGAERDEKYVTGETIQNFKIKSLISQVNENLISNM